MHYYFIVLDHTYKANNMKPKFVADEKDKKLFKPAK